MSTKDFTANVISATKVVPDGNFKDSKASGIWDINEALDLIKGGNWPNAANINPAAFVDALFQTHLYSGTGSASTITNNINLSGSGGLVWIKERTSTSGHILVDTERGVGKYLSSDTTNAEQSASSTVSAFNSNGFTQGGSGATGQSSQDYVSWTFRKQPKFFDVVTYTGNGSVRNISHNLGAVPGMIIVKCTTKNSSNWTVYHRGLDASSPEDKYVYLSATNSVGDFAAYWNDTAPTSSVFTLGAGNGDDTNADGETYVAYIFAHNNDDGGFGEPGDQDIIKCGSYTGAGSSNAVAVDLGFEPQWVMIKNATQSEVYTSWVMGDTMRTNVAVGTDYHDGALFANRSYAEGKRGNGDSPDDYLNINTTSTGFSVPGISNYELNVSGETYIYMAIRRGGMQTPTAASSVFDVEIGGSSVADNALATTTGFPVDMFMHFDNYSSGGEAFVVDRMRGRSKQFRTQVTNAEATYSTNNPSLDSNSGLINRSGSTQNLSGGIYWQWRRARGYFDVVAYTGNGTTGTTINHNLGVVPEMIWIRDRSTSNLHAYHKGLNGGTDPEDYTLRVNQNGGQIDTNAVFNDTAPTASVFSTGSAMSTDGNNYIAYLFATVAGVSKVGSFTQSGATNVDCGFTGDTPALIIYKRTDAAGNWHIYDSVRGIVAGNDPHVFLDTNDNEQSSDYIDPYSGGFATTSGVTNGDYIFYAIAATS